MTQTFARNHDCVNIRGRHGSLPLESLSNDTGKTGRRVPDRPLFCKQLCATG